MIPFFIITIIILAVLNIEFIWNPPYLFTVLNIIFLTIIMVFISLLAVRSYLINKSLTIVLLGSGTLALGLGGLLAALSILGNMVNTTVTIYNTSACISGFFILISAILSIRSNPKILKSSWTPLAFYMIIIVIIMALALLVQKNAWPVYFIQGSGPTSIGLAVLYTTIILFGVSCILLINNSDDKELNFRRWYGLGLGLIAVGLFGVSIQSNVGDPLNWVGRTSQYLGAVYILIAIFSSIRETGNWILPWEQALQESEIRYRAIVETANEGILLSDLKDNITLVNQKMVDMLGYPMEKLIGKPIISIVHSQCHRELSKRVENCKKGLKAEYELKLVRMDGSFLWAHVSASPIVDIKDQTIGILDMIIDTTQRKQAEQDIKRHGKVLEGINQVLSESLTCETESEVIVKCLKVAEELTESEFGFFGEINVNGRLDDRALSPPAWDKCKTPNAIDLLKNMEIRGYWGRTILEERSQLVNDPDNDPDRRGLPEGHPPISSFMGVPLKQGDKTIGMIALANKKEGYTEDDKVDLEVLSVAFVEALMRKRAELTLKENVKKLAHSNRELQQFAYISSHDLREPLRIITSFLQLLEHRYRDQLDQDANDFIDFAVNGAKRMDMMINDLLEYSKITSKKREFSRVDTEKVLDETLMNLKVPIEENNAIITHDPMPTVVGDEKLLVQLFQNLISNGIKYRREVPMIHVSSQREKDYQLFSVSDNGIGISNEHLPLIFTIFKRLHTKEEYEGTGIGLSIAQKIVEQHGGKIWAESEPGKGTKFYFTIPLKFDLLSSSVGF
jgi:PAS domain S-box-containing protein